MATAKEIKANLTEAISKLDNTHENSVKDMSSLFNKHVKKLKEDELIPDFYLKSMRVVALQLPNKKLQDAIQAHIKFCEEENALHPYKDLTASQLIKLIQNKVNLFNTFNYQQISETHYELKLIRMIF